MGKLTSTTRKRRRGLLERCNAVQEMKSNEIFTHENHFFGVEHIFYTTKIIPPKLSNRRNILESVKAIVEVDITLDSCLFRIQ